MLIIYYSFINYAIEKVSVSNLCFGNSYFPFLKEILKL
jgi:hypothetical protein